jgi:hypothetical protein
MKLWYVVVLKSMLINSTSIFIPLVNIVVCRTCNRVMNELDKMHKMLLV